ncbi:MAG: sel1 repeat family protein [Candidatus Izimaplasma sp.]|nr:sel1 repeat family protein [Candidatus Izimaplasma bacterium]
MEQLEKAKQLYIAKKYKDSFNLFKTLADSLPEASYYLGMHYYLGLATKQKYDLAYEAFKRSWEGLYPEGIYMLGRLYETGRGVNKNLKQAINLYQAAKDSENAKLRLAIMYEEGIGCDKDLAKAIKLYNDLQKLGNSFAMYKIGRFYLQGKGLKKNLNNGYKWLNKALSKGNLLAMNYFRLIGSRAKEDIRSTTEIYKQALGAIKKEQKQVALSLLEIAAKEGLVEACFTLYRMYLTGKLVKKDEAQAFKQLLKYQDLNDKDLYYEIGMCYEKGIGVDSSYYRAGIFYKKAMELDHEDAKIALRELRGY